MDRETNQYIKEELGEGNVYEVEINDYRNELWVNHHKREMKYSVDLFPLFVNKNVTHLNGVTAIDRIREIFGADCKILVYATYYTTFREGVHNYETCTTINGHVSAVNEFDARYIVVSKKKIKEELFELFPGQINSDTENQC